MKKIFLLLICLNSWYAYSQHLPHHIVLNINEPTLEQIQHIKHLSGSHDEYWFVINDSSDVSNLKKFHGFWGLHLMVNVKVLPKEIELAGDSLFFLEIKCGSSLTDISAVNSLKKLNELRIKGYAGETFPDLDNLTQLNSLSLNNTRIKNFSVLSDCTVLRKLTIISAPFKTLEGISGCKLLDELDLDSLNNLSSLDGGISGMKLTKLSITNCGALTTLNQISGSKSLKTLVLYKLSALHVLDIDMSDVNMADLGINDCTALANLNAISKSRTLKNLSLRKLSSFKDIDFDMSQIPLFELSLDSLPLKNISHVKFCKTLSTLNIYGLYSLINIDFSNNKTMLKLLSVIKCPSLKEVTGVAECKQLQMFYLRSNQGLNKIDDFQKYPPSLAEADIENNPSLQIPDQVPKRGAPKPFLIIKNNYNKAKN